MQEAALSYASYLCPAAARPDPAKMISGGYGLSNLPDGACAQTAVLVIIA
jgi:hypothetical protein